MLKHPVPPAEVIRVERCVEYDGIPETSVPVGVQEVSVPVWVREGSVPETVSPPAWARVARGAGMQATELRGPTSGDSTYNTNSFPGAVN